MANDARPMTAIGTDNGQHVDTMGRSGFARHLLKIIQTIDNNSGAIVGLEGEWGSGKTWILDQLDVFSEKIDH